MTRPDWRDISVWSNVLYVVPAAFAPTWLAAWAVGTTGLLLGLASATYHALYERWAQRIDIAAMLAFIVALAAALAAPWTPWVYFAVPFAAAIYYRYKWHLDSHVQVGAWSAVLVGLLALRAGWWALLPTGLFALGATIGYLRRGRDTAWHALWHALTATAATVALALV